jgi:hypothetical protein
VSGIKRGSSERSNRYSESKCTNWSRYNPFDLEISALPDPDDLKPELSIKTKASTILIYVRDVHADFIRPVEADDIRKLLSCVPSYFLHSLESIYLLGGTSKQLRASKKSFRYGCYEPGRIYLYTFPRRMLKDHWGQLPKPTIVEEYKRMGAEWKQNNLGWWLEFDQSSLKRFYLFDVLLHELGHHVDRRIWRRDTESAERYAEWFAQEYARLITELDANS